MIEVVYIATGSYAEYRHGFFSTFKYFAPGRKKHVTILSNVMDDCEGIVLEDGTKVNVVKIFDLLYPCINLHKSYFIEQLGLDADYIFYFDADTMFKNVPYYDWDAMFAEMDEGNVIISKHPVYSLKDGGKLYGWEKENWISNFCTENVTEKDPKKRSYIAKDSYTYVISSFFAASRETMRVLNETIIIMCRADLTRNMYGHGYYIPAFMDENYFNALASDYDDGINNNGLKFSVKQYSQLYGKDDETVPSPDTFIYQKNFPDHKKNRR